MSERLNHVYEFGSFSLDANKRLLLRAGEPLPLAPKVLETLIALVENRGRVLSKDELLKQVWGDTMVEEGGLTRNISVLRKALGERPDDHQYIVTVPAQGYRFVAEVQERREGIEEAPQVPPLSEGNVQPTGAPSVWRWQILAGIFLLAIVFLAFMFMRSHATDAIRPEIKSVAVLPLENLSADPAQQHFADAMTEELISHLGQIRALRVISRTSAMTYKGSKKPIPTIGQELKVDAVVEGSVQREDGRVKFIVKLIHASTDRQLWQNSYERELTDILKLQSDVARGIADEIRVQVTAGERARLASARSVDPAAHEEYLKGRVYLWHYIIDDFKRAMAHFERAIHIDPNYAAAYAGLAHAWAQWGWQGPATVKEVEGPARTNARKALELDDQLAIAHVSQGYVKVLYDWDWQGGENSIKRALQLDPNSLDAHFIYATLLTALGRFPEAVSEMNIAEQLDPLSAEVQDALGRILFYSGKTDEAVLRVKRAIDMEPRSAGAHGLLADIYTEMDRHTEALALYDKARVLRGNPPDNPPFLAILARVYARMGKRSEARRILKGLTNELDSGKPWMATAYAALGDNDQAFRALSKVVEQREELAIWIKSDPQYESLHSDPRWRTVLERMNFQVD